MLSILSIAAYSAQDVLVQPGNTLSGIFNTYHISPMDLKRLLETHEPKLMRLQPGDRLSLTVNTQGSLTELNLTLKTGKMLHFSKVGRRFTKKIHIPPEKMILTLKSGEISTSLAHAIQKAKLPHAVYQQLVSIFKKQINFNRQLHPGDQFSVLYEEYFSEGRKIRTGHIMAAEIKIHHRVYQAVRFAYPHHVGYYNPKGESMDALFLSYPLQFKRISSTFTRHRLDPVLHAIHPHLGIDFAAAGGTPIYSVGAGTIVFLGKSRGYGNTLKIQYGPHYEALYGHLQSFARPLKTHQSVSKGQIIGYVGSTGWATGSHLHFSFCVDGVPVNWLQMEKPLTTTLPSAYRSLFRKKTQALLAQLHAPSAAP